MNTKHTPGPWTMRAAISGRYPDYPIVGPNGEPVARVPIMAHGRSGEYARLIAAAPELLAALEWAAAYVELFTGNGCRANPQNWPRMANGDPDPERIAQVARATIAAARGEG